MIGVSFQPGANGENGQHGSGPTRNTTGGVQEAIKILSLRLPKVVGAQSAVPMPLLTSQGSGGNPRVDAIVNQVLSRVGQGQAPRGPSMPVQPSQPGPMQGPSFGGSAMPQYQPPQQQTPWQPPPGFNPRVVIDSNSWGDTMTGPDGRPLGSGPGAIADLPPNFQQPPQMPAPLPDIFGWMRRDQPAPEPIPFDQPLF